MERGVYQPSLGKLLEICGILGLTPNDLLVGERKPDGLERSKVGAWEREGVERIPSLFV